MSADSIFELAQDFEEKSLKITTKLDSSSSKTAPPPLEIIKEARAALGDLHYILE